MIGAKELATMPLTNKPRILLGLIGAGIQRSLTPAMHEREGDAHGLRCLYQLIDLERMQQGVDALPRLLDAAEAMGFVGLNITHPAKQAVIPLLDELSEEARAIGAVNTVVFKDGRRIGHNTDCWGFAEGLRRGLPDAQLRRVVQLGAGGAGAATAHAALAMGAQQLEIFDTDPERASALAASLCQRFGSDRAVAPGDLGAAMAAADGLIHATPTGTAGHPGLPLPAAMLRPSHWVAEIVYFPLHTALIETAARIGCRTATGGGMAVFQAVKAFELFTGIVPDGERMQQHFAALQAAGG
jgi:shikimate dehydrogenase